MGRMTNKELVEEFTNTRATPEGIAILVRTIKWPHPHTPRCRWQRVVSLSADADEAAVLATRKAVLRDARFFRVCRECRGRKPVGWMRGAA